MANKSTEAHSKPKAEAVYAYQGQGFVPGLPKAVTFEEAEKMGVLGLLKEAIAAGKYKEQAPKGEIGATDGQ